MKLHLSLHSFSIHLQQCLYANVLSRQLLHKVGNPHGRELAFITLFSHAFTGERNNSIFKTMGTNGANWQLMW